MYYDHGSKYRGRKHSMVKRMESAGELVLWLLGGQGGLPGKVACPQGSEGTVGACEGSLREGMWELSVFCLLCWGLEELVLETEK